MRYTKELVIGITAIAPIICFVWGFNFLKGKNVFTTKRDYYAFYEHVHGLQVGQPVTINSIEINPSIDESEFEFPDSVSDESN